MLKIKNTYPRFYIFFILITVLASCNSKRKANIEKEREPIVSVNEKVLYKSDLENAISESLNSADSTTSAEAYIKMWINEELIYDKAQQNITDPARIDEMVEQYRQSLTVFSYLEQLLKRELSKKISEKELKDYYDKHPDNFKLESSLVKGLFLKIPKTSSELSNLRQWYKSNKESAIENIEKTSLQNTVIYDYFYDQWINIDDILSNIPIPITDPNQFVKTNKNFETQDSLYVYLLHIEEYALAGSNSPYIYAKPQITEILINKHRETFLKQFEKDLYDKAIDAGDIQYYIERGGK